MLQKNTVGTQRGQNAQHSVNYTRVAAAVICAVERDADGIGGYVMRVAVNRENSSEGHEVAGDVGEGGAEEGVGGERADGAAAGHRNRHHGDGG